MYEFKYAIDTNGQYGVWIRNCSLKKIESSFPFTSDKMANYDEPDNTTIHGANVTHVRN